MRERESVDIRCQIWHTCTFNNLILNVILTNTTVETCYISTVGLVKFEFKEKIIKGVSMPSLSNEF